MDKMQKFSVTAEGESRMDIVSRISILYMQRHISVESLSFAPATGGKSLFRVCAFSDEGTMRRLVGQMRHIEGLHAIECKPV